MSDCRALYPITFIQRCAVPNLKIALRKFLKQHSVKRVSMRTVIRGQTKNIPFLEVSVTNGRRSV